MAQDSKAHETPEEFKRDILETYGADHWGVIREFILCDKHHIVDGGSGTIVSTTPDPNSEMKKLLAILDTAEKKTEALGTEDSETMVCPLTDRMIGSSDGYVTL